MLHIKNIWGDINSWWNDPDVVSVRNEFTNKYAKSNNLVDKLCLVFNDVLSRKN